MKRFFYILVWLWMIIVGGLLITPGGIFCIVCGATIDTSGFIGKNAVFVIGVVSILMGIIGFATLKKQSGENVVIRENKVSGENES